MAVNPIDGIRQLATNAVPAYTRELWFRGRDEMSERIGDYMIRKGVMSQSQVDEVARAKASGDARHFGEIAISLGFIKPADVEGFLAAQK